MNKKELLEIAKPILFNTPMVGAILDNRKTVTRRVERLQDISPEDAHDEGISFRPFNSNYPNFREWLIKDFHELWDSTIKKSDLLLYGWEASPWVWVIEFERMEVSE